MHFIWELISAGKYSERKNVSHVNQKGEIYSHNKLSSPQKKSNNIIIFFTMA